MVGELVDGTKAVIQVTIRGNGGSVNTEGSVSSAGENLCAFFP